MIFDVQDTQLRTRRIDFVNCVRPTAGGARPAFPSISTGAFVYPIRLAAPVALKAIVDFLNQEKHDLDEVRIVLYTREDEKAYAVYAQALQELLGSGAESDVPGTGRPKVVSATASSAYH